MEPQQQQNAQALSDLARACEAAAAAVRDLLAAPPGDHHEARRRVDAALEAVEAARARLDALARR